ncbi:glycosyltransferase [bacterium]|nr:glycosyltransferase [bacterium]
MTTAPLVTVLTVTYNGGRYLAATIESVLGQTFTDFEYLIVDNASTDHSRQIVEAYAARDRRVRLIESPVNCGPAGGLNLGLQAARGKYVANLDHDDLAAAHRLAVQIDVLESNPDVGFVGGWMRFIDEDGQLLFTYEHALSHEQIHWSLMTHCELSHSATTFRRDVVTASGGYSQNHHLLCDYELFSRLRDRTRFLNIADYLVDYRYFSGQSSRRYRQAQHLQILMLWASIQREISATKWTFEAWHHFYRAWKGEPLAEATPLLEGAAVAEAIVHDYLAHYAPNPQMAALVQHDGAIWLLTMALRHRTRLPQTARHLYGRALYLNPTLWADPHTWAELRRIRRIQAYRKAVNSPMERLPFQ